MKFEHWATLIGSKANSITFLCGAVCNAALVDQDIARQLGGLLADIPGVGMHLKQLAFPLVKLANICFLLWCSGVIALLFGCKVLHWSKASGTDQSDFNLLRVLDAYIKQSRWVFCLDCIFLFLVQAEVAVLNNNIWVITGLCLALRNVIAYIYRTMRYGDITA